MNIPLEPFDEDGENGHLLEVARAEAAIVLSIDDGTAPPTWAIEIYEKFIRGTDEVMESEFAGRWIPDAQFPAFDRSRVELLRGELSDERIDALAGGFSPTAAEVLKFQVAALRCMFDDFDDCSPVAFGFVDLHAPGNRECIMMYSVDGAALHAPAVKVRGYFSSKSAAVQQLSATGVLEESFNADGVLTLPGPRDAVAECARRASWPKDLGGGGGGLGKAIGSGLRRRAADWFARTYFEQHLHTPSGTFDVECSYGQGEGFDIDPPNIISSQKGQISEKITFY